MTYAKKEKPRKFECEQCNKRFLSKNDLRKHALIHTDEKPHVCTKCNQAFRQAGSLKNHLASKHSHELESPEVYICNYCSKVFPIKERLRLHLRIHTGDKPYTCQLCPKTFARGGQLAQHMRVHTGAKPFVCQICDAKFTCTANLKLHVNRHMDIRDFVCDICGKSFFRRDALRKHLNCFHKNIKAFRCKICNKDFKGHLPQHMRTHRNDKPHGCGHCGSRFAQRSQLIVHQRVHSGEKPYRCRVCWKAFAHSTALKLHTRQHTGEKPFECLLCSNIAFSQLPHLKKHMLCIHKTKKPYICQYCKTFHKKKNDLEVHYRECKKKELADIPKVKEEPKKGKKDDIDVGPAMSLETMRFLLAILLRKIAPMERLKELGFNKKLIDDVLVESIKYSNHEPCAETNLTTAERLKKNIQIFLEWTVPEKFMSKFKTEQRSTEELLEELTS